jgi:LuxR family transcriptional regulator, maltose regulon positive regulatory protein
MSERIPALPASAAQLGIAPHRLAPPRSHDAALGRDRLLERLDRARGPVVLVIAGAGYGKSTLLGRWCENLDCETAWLSLDAGDNDPVRLLRGILASLHTVAPDAGLLRVARDVGPRTTERALAQLDEQLNVAAPFVFVLDDAHFVTDPGAARVLDTLIESLPPGSRIVLSGRSTPPVRTARLQLAGALDSIDATDLLFTPDETDTLLHEFADRADRRSMIDRLEGWPAGVQFVALGMRRANGDRIDDPTTQSAQLLTSYFQQEFLRALPHAERQFLIRTSVLDRLSGDLCDHVLDHPGSAEHLEELVRAGNVFVVPIAGTGVFRYHPLFGDLLLGELRRSAPELEAPLRRRAIEWHDMHGEWASAVDQAVASNGAIDASAEMFRHLRPALASGHVATVGRWLDGFDPADIRSNALLGLTAAWCALFGNRASDVDLWLRAAEHATFTGPLPDGTVDVATAAAAVRMVAGEGGVRLIAEMARIVLEAGEGGGPWRSLAFLLESVALQLAGAVDDARPLFEIAEFETRGFAAAHAVTIAHLGIDELYRGNDSLGARHVRRAVEEIDASGLHEFAQVAIVFAAQSLAEARAGAFAASRLSSDHVEYLLGTMDTVHLRSQIHHNLILADAALIRGEHAAASRLLRTAQARLPEEPDAVVLHEWVARIARRCANAMDAQPVELTPAEHRVLEQLATHRTLAEIGDHLYVSRNTVKTHTVSIYRKLLVSGRSAAVERARDLGLLDERSGENERTAASIR